MIVKPEKKALIMALRNPNKVLTVLPQAKLLVSKQDRSVVAVKHTLDVFKVLTNIGLKPPHPIKFYYDFPTRYDAPMSHQVETAAFLSTHTRAYCLNGMGSAKTLSSLWAFDYLRSLDKVDAAIVLAPLSTLERTWSDEVFHHLPHLEAAVVHGTAARRRRVLDTPADIYVINHDGIGVVLTELLQIMKHRRVVLIIDELAVFRNARTNRWKACDQLVKASVYAWGLTGTPIPNDPSDAYGQIKLITPKNAPRSFTMFQDLVSQPVGPYKRVPRINAVQTVHTLMQPAIRYATRDCIDLPPTLYVERHVELSPTQMKAFKQMQDQKVFQATAGGARIIAINEAVVAMKLVQIACIEYNTPVLTKRGWVPIQFVTPNDLVFDGVEFVGTGGVVLQGAKPTVTCYGVRMTEDHRVLTTAGWKEAQEVLNAEPGERFDRAEVRIPDGDHPVWVETHREGLVECRRMAVPVRVRNGGGAAQSVSEGQAPTTPAQLRLQERQRDARDVYHAAVQNMDQHAPQVQQPDGQGLAQVWRAWRYSVRSVGGVVRGVLGGYVQRVFRTLDLGAGGQRRAILTGELPVGDACRASEQPTHDSSCGNAAGAHDGGAGGGPVWDKASDLVREAAQGGSGLAPVYDIVDCGPRNRFVVLGSEGPLIVHNCGAVYVGEDQEPERIESPERMSVVEEVIGEAEGKVIVFCPVLAALDYIADTLREKGHAVGQIDGRVAKHDRDRIFSEFQGEGTDVIVAQPGAMSHGLTLTRGSVIIWYAPCYSNETYEQANARIVRPGQKRNTLIVNIEGTGLERGIYSRLKSRQKVQGELLELARDS